MKGLKGIGPATVIPHRAPKSSSAEDTFATDTGDMDELKKWLLSQSEEVGRDLRKHGLKGKTITLKVKFANFKIVTRSTTLPEATHSTRIIYDTAVKLLIEAEAPGKGPPYWGRGFQLCRWNGAEKPVFRHGPPETGRT